MEKEIRHLVQTLHDTPGRIVLVAAGAGSSALSWLQGVAGASRTLLEGLVPYQEPSFIDFLGARPEQFVSLETAGLLAGKAYRRALFLGDRMPEGEQRPVTGLVCTATIATDRLKRGEHRAHIGYWNQEKMALHSIYLEKGARGRQAEELIVSRLIMNALSEAFGLSIVLSIPLKKKDRYDRCETDFKSLTSCLLNKEIPFFGIGPDGFGRDTPPKALLSGSFNPLHKGHQLLANAAEKLLNTPVAFELAVVNADKPALLLPEVLNRLAQFAGQSAIFASSAPTFVEKAQLYPGTTFVVGFDTAERILQSRFYNNSEAARDEALEKIRQLNGRFLVAGRVNPAGNYRDAAALAIPPTFTELFQPIPADLFRRDISSTEIRQSENGEPGQV